MPATPMRFNSGLYPVGRLIDIDGQSAAASTIMVIPPGPRQLRLMFLMLTVTAGSVLTTPATVTLGTIGPGFSNLMGATALTGLTVLNRFLNLPLGASTGIIALLAGADIKLNITTPATGTGTLYRAELWGSYGGNFA